MSPSISHAKFRKSSYSSGHGQNCVEVADLDAGSAVRDSQHPEQAILDFPRSEWAALIGSVRLEGQI